MHRDAIGYWLLCLPSLSPAWTCSRLDKPRVRAITARVRARINRRGSRRGRGRPSSRALFIPEDLTESENERLDAGYSGYPMGELESLGYEYLDGEGASCRFTDGEGKIITVYAESRIY